jgi:hypothetical protein
MTQEIIDTIASLLREHDEKPFGTVGEIIASKLTSLGWASPTEREAIRAAALEEAIAWHEQKAYEIEDANSRITGFMMQYDNAKLNPMDKHHRACADAILALANMPPEYVVVPIEPNEVQRQHVENLVSIFVADDDHLRFVTSDLIIRSYRAMCRTMITKDTP